MERTISSVDLARLTGDNRKWIYRNAESTGAVAKHGKVLKGRGEGIRFTRGEDLDRWVKRRKEQRARIAEGKPTADVAMILSGGSVLFPLSQLDASTRGEFLRMPSKENRQSRVALIAQLRRIADRLNDAAEEIERQNV